MNRLAVKQGQLNFIHIEWLSGQQYKMDIIQPFEE